MHEHLIENENIMKSAFCFDFSEAALYTETLRPTPGLWGNEDPSLSPGIPTGYAVGAQYSLCCELFPPQ